MLGGYGTDQRAVLIHAVSDSRGAEITHGMMLGQRPMLVSWLDDGCSANVLRHDVWLTEHDWTEIVCELDDKRGGGVQAKERPRL